MRINIADDIPQIRSFLNEINNRHRIQEHFLYYPLTVPLPGWIKAVIIDNIVVDIVIREQTTQVILHFFIWFSRAFF